MSEEGQLNELDIRIQALEDEFKKAKKETQQLMLDVRAMLMEYSSPLKSQNAANRTTARKGGRG
jgi:hypothetical protein